MSNPNCFTCQTFDDLLQDISNQAYGISINHEISQLVCNPCTSSKPHPQCTNPKCPLPVGHMTANSWHEGGGDPGRKEHFQEKQKSKQAVRANLATTETPNTAEHEPVNDNTDTYKCTAKSDNKDIFFSYFVGLYESILPLANALFDLKTANPEAYYLTLEAFKALLNSGTTHHIVKDHKAFHTYDKLKALPVKMVNCGILTAFTIGDAHIRVNVGGQTATIIL
ncbi:hypothetical protein IW262DRAFT_1462479 [Armillaria fumosa]|nr:hypothetical protein IW262DRAFT_1462479 [Armillaria fumosa]